MLLRDILAHKKDLVKTALKFGNVAISYCELYRDVEHWAAELEKCKCKNRNIGIFLPNSPQYVIAYFAITFAGKTIVPIDIQAKKAELESTINYCELQLIISNGDYGKTIKLHLADSNCSVSILDLDNMTFYDAGNLSGCCDKNNTFYEDIVTNENEIALLLHTSGTTSNPKRVMLSHKNLMENVKSIIESLGLHEEDRTLISMPLYMASANTSQLLTHLYLGATVVIMNSMFLPTVFFSLVEEERITNFTGVPPYMYSICGHSYRNNCDISSLKLVCFGGAGTPVKKILQLLDTFPQINFVHMYGQTEASTRITHLLPEDARRKIGSVGKSISGVQVRLVNEEDKDVDPGQKGEIIVKGANVMSGYYKKPEETAKALKSGWLYTGDLGYSDPDGYLYIIGRRKNIIISGGMNIYPEEIEEILLCHPAVKEVFVFGDEDEYLGEVPAAHIVINEEGSSTTEDELINYCYKHLSKFKIPRRIVFVPGISKTPTGKIIRY